MTDRKTVFLTGATGNMGWAGFQELYKKGKFNIRLLARDSRKNHKKLDRYDSDPSVTVIWQIVMDCIIIGNFTLISVCREVAPSIFAASSKDSGTDCKPAM